MKSCYNRFKEKLPSPPLPANSGLALSHLWRIKVLSKILCFRWRVILNRIASKDQLLKRGIVTILNDLTCVFCAEEEESLSHILSRCETVSEIWRKVYCWMGSMEEITLEEFEVFFDHCDKVKRLFRRRIVVVIWIA